VKKLQDHELQGAGSAAESPNRSLDRANLLEGKKQLDLSTFTQYENAQTRA